MDTGLVPHSADCGIYCGRMVRQDFRSCTFAPNCSLAVDDIAGDRGGFVTGRGDGTEQICGCLAGAWYLICSCAAELNVLANRTAPREHGDPYRQLEKLAGNLRDTGI